MAGAGGRKASSCWTELLSQNHGNQGEPEPTAQLLANYLLNCTCALGCPRPWGVVQAEPPQTKASARFPQESLALPCFSHSELKPFTKLQHQVGRKERELGPRASLAQPDRSQRVNKSSSADKMPQIPGLASNGECIWQMSTIKKYILMAHDAAATVGRSPTKQVLSSHYCVLLPGTRATPPSLFHKLWP